MTSRWTSASGSRWRRPPVRSSSWILRAPRGVARADGEWHHPQVNLLEGLQHLYPQLSTPTVTHVVLSPPWESYAWCGIGGNGLGTVYWIDNFRIGPAQ